MSEFIALIGKKLGMTHIYDKNNICPVTLIEILPNEVFAIKSSESVNGYNSIAIAGADEVKDSKVNKPQLSMFKKNNLKSRNVIKEFRFKNNSKEITFNNIKVGDKFTIGDYLLNAKIDIRGVSQGKGFQGAMKRWNFAGMPASHGVSLTHRSHGSTGNRTLPGRVFKGKKMAGHMGATNICMQNLIIKFVDVENNIIAVKGSVPGAQNTVVYITNSIKSIVSNASSINGVK